MSKVASQPPRQSRRPWLRVMGSVLFLTLVALLLSLALRRPALTPDARLGEISTAAKRVLQQDFPAARQHLKRIAEGGPVPVEHLVRVSQLAIDAEDASLAAQFLDQLEAAQPASVELQILRGVVALRAQQAAVAEQHWRKAVELRPDLSLTWERLTQLFMTQIRGGEIRWALEGLSRCRALELDELIVYASAYEPYYSAEERLKTVESYLAADPHDSESLVAVARYLLLEGRVDDAIAQLLKGADFPPAVALLIDAELRRGGTVSESIRQQVATLPLPLPPMIYRARGLLAASESDWNAAAWNLRQAVSAQPIDAAAWYRLGQALERLQQTAAAEAALRIGRKNEDLSNLIFRIRKTSHLPLARLTPLILDVVELQCDLARVVEAEMWSPLVPPQVETVRREAVLGRIMAARTEGSIQLAADWQHIRSVSLTEPASWMTRPLPDRSAAVATTSAPSETGHFTDCAAQAGINFQFQAGGIGRKGLLETLGGGVAVLDYDGDGWPDLYFCQGAPLVEGGVAPPSADSPSDRLYRNLGNGSFADVTLSAGLGDRHYSQGCTAGDFDNDGDQDLVISNYGNCVFYRNNGDGTFSDMSAEAALPVGRWFTSLAFSDLDLDGDLDLFITTYVGEAFKVCRRPDGTFSTCSPANYPAEQDVLLLNRGDGSFEDITAAAGIEALDGKGLGVVIADLNNDGRPDIYVTNDGTPNFLFRNEGLDEVGRPHFQEVGLRAGCAVNSDGMAQAGMGIACADFDGNGLLDLYTTNFFNEGSTLYLNLGDTLFEDATARAGLWEPTRKLLGFGVQALDFNNSSHAGVFIANGHIDDFGDRHEPWKMRSQLIANDGQARFQEVSKSAGPFFEQEILGRAVAKLDFNRDLRPDLVVTCLDRPAALLRNACPGPRRSIALRLIGTKSNRDGVGCRVVVRVRSVDYVYQRCGGDGFLASNEPTLLFGIGSSEFAESVRIDWPSGQSTVLQHLIAGTTWRVTEGLSSLDMPVP